MTIATIISISSGQAWARDEAGNLRELRVGDTLQEGETLITSDNARVQLDFDDGLDPTMIEGGQTIVMTPDLDAEQPVASEESSAQDEDLQALLTAIDEGEDDLLEDLAATAAGAGGAGGDGGGHDFVRLARINEDVDPLAYEFSTASLDTVEFDEAEPNETLTGTVSFELFSGDVTVGGDSVVEGNSVTVVATLDTAPVDSPLVITLSNGQQITIPVGETSGQLVLDTREDDVFVQGDEALGLSVTGATGGGFDELTVGEVPPLTVIDDNDASTVTLSGPESVTELDDITLTATVDNAPETDLTLTLDNDEQIVIPAGQTSGSVTFVSPNVPDGDGERTFTIVEADGGNYEALVIEGASQTTEIIDRLPEAGEEADQLGDAALLTGSAETTGTLDLDFGGDGAGSVGFAAMDGETGTLGTEEVTFSWNASTNTLTATGPRGELFNIAVDPQSGAYTATLVDNVLHEEGSDQDSLNLTYTVTDADGSTADGVFSLSIVDDLPEAADDASAITEDTTALISGDVLANDTESADTPSSVSFDSTTATYGTFTDNGDGTWSYQLDNSLAAVQALDDGDTLTETFAYTLTDDDGDESPATLTITIDGQTDGPPTIVVEDADGSLTGADNSVVEATSNTVSGTATVTAEAGIAALTADGQDITNASATNPVTLTGDYGTLVITGFDAVTGVISYDYTEDGSAEDHTAGDDSIVDSFGLSVTDLAGETASDSLDIQIRDTEPKANNDIDQVPTGTFAVISGNVVSNDTIAADAAAVSQVSSNGSTVSVPATGSVDIDGNYGTLTLDADGNYSYSREAGTPGDVQDVFTYTLADADGDSDLATLTIAIGDAGVDIGGLTPASGPADEVVDEGNLSDGSSPNPSALTQIGTFTISAPDGVANLSVGGTTVISSDVFTAQTITTPLGNTLEITGYDPATGVVSYSYTLDDNENHPTGDGENSLFEDFVVSLSDIDGDSTTGSLRVEIIDDVPSVDIGDSDPTSVAEDAASPITGTIATVEGADQEGVLDITLTTGTLSSAIQLTLNGTAGSASATVNNGAQDLGTLTVSYDGSSVSWSFDPIAVDNDLATSFTFEATLTDADGDETTDSHTVDVTDGGGPSDATPISLSVDEDDLPAGSDTTKESLTAADTLTFTAGSDAFASMAFATDLSGLQADSDTLTGGDEITWSRVSDTQITGSVDSNVAITLTLTPNLAAGTASVSMLLSDTVPHQLGDDLQTNLDLGSVDVVATDTDGDTASGTVNLSVVDDVPSVDIGDSDPTSVAEDAASPITGTIATVEGADQEGVLDITLTTGTLSSAIQLTLNGTADSASATVNNGAQDLGTLTVSYDGSSVSWSFDPIAVDNDLATSFTFEATLTDADGDETTDSHTVDVTDGGGPSDATPISLSVDEDDLPAGSDTTKESLTAADTLTFTAGSDAFASMAFATDLSGLQADSDTLTGGDEITWSRVSDTQITGSVDSNVAITLTLTPNLAAGTASVSMLLSDTVPHQLGDDLQTNLDLGSVDVVATDTDGDTASGTVNLSVVDDVPSVDIGDSDPTSVAEDAASPITGTIATVEGADQEGVLDITLTTGTLSSAIQLTLNGTADSASATVNNGAQDLGTLTVSYDGSSVSWSFDPIAVDNDLATSFTFEATLTDADGDETTDSHTVDVTDGGGPSDATPISLSVDEDDLPAGSDTTKESLTAADTLTFTAGSDAFASMAFATDLSGLQADSDTLTGGDEITWSRVSDTQITGSVDSNVAITLTLTPNLAAGTASVSMLLSDTVPHQLGDDLQTNLDLGSVDVVATDTDGDTASGTVNLSVVDDVPSVDIGDSDPTSVAEDAASPITGTIATVEGADQEGVLDITLTTGTLSSAIQLTLNGTADSASATVNNGAQDLGTLTVSYDGSSVSWSFDPIAVDNDLATSFTFEATLTDADGDETTDSHTVTVTEGGDPGDATPISLSVDEDDLPAGSDQSDSLTDTQTLTFTPGADAFASMAFATDLSGLQADSDTLTGGDEITWSRVSDTQITGSVNGNVAITLTLTPNLAAGTASVSMLLSDTVPHQLGDDLQTNLDLGSVDVVATDTDGDTASGTVNLSVVDDVPSVDIGDSDPTSVAEDAASPITGTIATVEGADQEGVLDITLTTGTLSSAIQLTLNGTADSASATVNNGAQDLGTLTVSYDGSSVSWSFDPIAVDNDLATSFTFEATLTDADGDETTDSHTVDVTDGGGPSDATPISLSVDEDDLPAGSDTTKESLTAADTLTFTAGSDAFASMAFATDLSGLQADSDTLTGGDEITWSRVSDTQITGSVDSNVAITLTLTPNLAAGTASVSMLLSDTVPHQLGDDLQTNLDLGSVDVVATDTDGDTASGTVNLSVVDDVPSVDIGDSDPTSVAEDAASPITGTIATVEGADQEGVLDITLTTGTLSSAIQLTLNGTADSASATVNNGAQDLGTLTVSYDGSSVSWSFDPIAVDNDLATSFTFEATLTDADGDETTDSHTVTVTEGGDPGDATPISLSVDEDDLPAGSDQSDSLTDTQTLTFTPGADAFASMAFATDLSGLQADSDTLTGGDEITWSRVSDTQITGSVNGNVAITLTLTPNLAAGTASVSMLLSDTVPHQLGDDLQTNLDLGSVDVVATDTDGDTASGTVNLSVVDDVPSVDIGDSDPTSVAEDAASPITGTIATVEGADQEGVLDITLTTGTLSSAIQLTLNGTADSASATVNNGAQDLGTLTVSYDGSSVSWSFDPIAVDNDLATSFTFEATLTDADGDETTDSHTVDVTDGGGPSDATPISLSVDEDDLPAGSDTTKESLTAADTLTFTAGSDAFASMAFATDLSGLQADSDTLTGGDEITWSRVSDTQITGSVDSNVAITLTLTPNLAAGTASVSMLLSDTVPHQLGDDLQTNLDLGSVDVVATDTDGDTASGTVNLSVVDDVPSVDIGDSDPTSVAEDAASPITGTIATVEGADQEGVLDITLTTGTLSSAIQLTLNGTADSASATVNNGAQDLGTLTVSYDGSSVSWSFDPIAVDNDLATSFTFEATLTDADGDETTDSHTVTVTEGGDPGDATPISLSVDEDDLPAGSDQSDSLTDTQTLTFTPGADAFASMAFATDLSGLQADSDTLTGGDEITWSRVSDTQITGSVNGNVAITLTLTPNLAAGTASVSMLLSDTVPHQLGDDLQTNLDLGSVDVVATDTDGDTASGTVNLSVVDDVPFVIVPDAGYLVNLAGQTVSAIPLDSDGNVDDNYGADQGGTVKLVTDSSVPSGYTSSSQDIYYYTDGSLLVGSTLAGSDFTTVSTQINGDYASHVVFDLELNTDGSITQVQDTYSFNLFQQIDGGVGEFNTDTGAWDISGGNTNYVYYQDASGSGLPSVLITPTGDDADQINTTANGVGASGGAGGQDVGGGETVRVDFVENISGTPTQTAYDPATVDHSFTNHVLVNGAVATFFINNGTSTVAFSAFDDNDFGQLDEEDDVGDYTQDNITWVTINDVIVEPNGVEPPGYSVDFQGDDVVIGGIKNGDAIAVFTEDGYTTVEYGYVSGSTFELGGFGASSFDPGALVNMNFDLEVTDADGDSVLVPGGINLQLSPDNHVIEMGTDNDDSLNAGADQASTLVGLAGDDTLTGDSGDDILVGGPGNDTMTGNLGADTFIWNFGDQSANTITSDDSVTDFTEGDFSVDPNSDRLDLADLLQGEDESSIGNYIFAEEQGSNVVLHISSDGTLGSGGADADQKITLENKSFSDFGDGTISNSGDLIQQMLDDGQLNIDQ